MSSKLNALVAALEAIDNTELEMTVTEAERKLRSAVSRATVEQNITVAKARQVPVTAALKVVDRYIAENIAADDPRDWMFFAAREVAHFLDYAHNGNFSSHAAKHTDLLPVGHPDSTNSALNFMSDPAVIRASAAWFASDDRIAPEAYDAVFNAFATIPGTADHQFATARLRALPAGLVPSELVIKPIVAAFGVGNPFAGGNSSAARSARARAQRRDSKGRFAEMGGGARFSGLFDGFGQSITGKIAGVPQDSNDIEIEVLNHPRLPNGIYPINANGVEGVKAVLRTNGATGKSIPVTDRRALANAVPEADLLATRKDAPTGWNKNPDGSYTSDDGYSVSMSDGSMQIDSRFKGGGVNGAYDPSLPVYKLTDDKGETVAFTQGWADIQKAAANNDESTGKSPVKARLRKIGEKLPPISKLRKAPRGGKKSGFDQAAGDDRLVKNVEDDSDFQYMIDPDKNDNYGEIEGDLTGRGDDMMWTIGMDDEVTITRQRDKNGKAEYIVQRSGEVYPATRWEPAEYDTVYEGVFDNIQDALEDGKSRTGDEGYGADEYYDQWGFDQAAGEDKFPEWEPDAKAFNDAVNELEKFDLSPGKDGDPATRTFTSSDGRVKVSVTDSTFFDEGDEDKLPSVRDYTDYSVEVDGQKVPTTNRASVVKAIAQGLDPNRSEKEQKISEIKKKRFEEMQTKSAQIAAEKEERIKQLDTNNLLSDSNNPIITDLLSTIQDNGNVIEGDGYTVSSDFDYEEGEATWTIQMDDGTIFEGYIPLDYNTGITEDPRENVFSEIKSILSNIDDRNQREMKNQTGFAQEAGPQERGDEDFILEDNLTGDDKAALDRYVESLKQERTREKVEDIIAQGDLDMIAEAMGKDEFQDDESVRSLQDAYYELEGEYLAEQFEGGFGQAAPGGAMNDPATDAQYNFVKSVLDQQGSNLPADLRDAMEEADNNRNLTKGEIGAIIGEMNKHIDKTRPSDRQLASIRRNVIAKGLPKKEADKIIKDLAKMKKDDASALLDRLKGMKDTGDFRDASPSIIAKGDGFEVKYTPRGDGKWDATPVDREGGDIGETQVVDSPEKDFADNYAGLSAADFPGANDGEPAGFAQKPAESLNSIKNLVEGPRNKAAKDKLDAIRNSAPSEAGFDQRTSDRENVALQTNGDIAHADAKGADSVFDWASEWTDFSVNQGKNRLSDWWKYTEEFAQWKTENDPYAADAGYVDVQALNEALVRPNAWTDNGDGSFSYSGQHLNEGGGPTIEIKPKANEDGTFNYDIVNGRTEDIIDTIEDVPSAADARELLSPAGRGDTFFTDLSKLGYEVSGADSNYDNLFRGYGFNQSAGFNQKSASMPDYLEEDPAKINFTEKPGGAFKTKVYEGSDGSTGEIRKRNIVADNSLQEFYGILKDKDGNIIAQRTLDNQFKRRETAEPDMDRWLRNKIAEHNKEQNKEKTGGFSAKQMEPATPAQYDMLQEHLDEREFDANTTQAIEEALANKNLTKAQMSTLIGQGNDASFKPGIDPTKPSDRQIKSLTNKLMTKDIDAAERDQLLSDLPGMKRDEVEALNNRLRSKKDIPGTAGFAQEAGDSGETSVENTTAGLNERMNEFVKENDLGYLFSPDELQSMLESRQYGKLDEQYFIETVESAAENVRDAGTDIELANDLDKFAKDLVAKFEADHGPVESARFAVGADSNIDIDDIETDVQNHIDNYFSDQPSLVRERLERNGYYGDNRSGGAGGRIQEEDGKYKAYFEDSETDSEEIGSYDSESEAIDALTDAITDWNADRSEYAFQLRDNTDGRLAEEAERLKNDPLAFADRLEELSSLMSNTRGGGNAADKQSSDWAYNIRKQEERRNQEGGFNQEAGTVSPKMGEPATDAQYGYIEELVGNKAGITTDLRQAVLDALEAKNLTKAQMGAIIGQLRALEFNPDFDPTKPTKRQINRAKDLAASLNLSPKERRELGLTRLNSMTPDEIGKLIDKLKRRGERGDSGEGSGGVRPKAPTRPSGGPGRGANRDGFAQGTPKERSVTPQSISRILANAGVTKSESRKSGLKRQGYRASEGFQVQTDSDGNVTVNYRQRMGSDIPYSRFNETTRLPALDNIKNALEEKGFVLTEKDEGGFKVTRIGDAFEQSVLDIPRVSETVDSPKAAEKIASDAVESNKKAEADLLGRIKDIIRGGAGSWSPNFDVRRGETRDDDQVTSSSAPINPISGHAYSASNFFALAAAGNERGYSDRRWMTALQAEKAGGKIRVGEQGVKILTPVEREVKYRDPKTGETKSRAVIEMREQYVFNAEQMDGLGPDTSPKSNGLTAGEALDLFLMRFAEAEAKRGGAGIPRINIGGGSDPRWIPGPSGESIRMPDRSMFESPEGFVQSLMHEIIHASGFESRLGRVSNTRGLRGDKRQIALEELSAELGSAILMQRMGVPYDIKKHAAYVDSHIRAEGLSEEDVNFAFAEAQIAADFALGNDVLPRWENLTTDFTKAPTGYRPKAPRSWNPDSELSSAEAPSAYPPGSPGSDENPMAAFAQAAAKKFSGKANKDSQSALDKVTEQLLEKIKTGAVPWRKPFKGIAGANLQRNPASKHIYTGVNQQVLSIMQLIRGYSDPRWMTYKQAETMGGQVRKGEKAVYILVPMRVNTEDATTGEESSFVMFRAAAVFNVEQIDGLELPTLESEGSKLNDFTPVEAHEFIVERYEKAMTARTGNPVKITYRDMSDQEAPHWNPGSDRIVLPNQGQFNSPEELFDTLTHEMVHSTGHADRLDRTELGKDYGKPDGVARAKEELIAEIGSALIADMFGVDSSFDNTAAYVQSWLQRLKSHPEEVIQASKEAQKAVDYILGTDLGDWSPLDGYGPGLGVVPKKEEKENG